MGWQKGIRILYIRIWFIKHEQTGHSLLRFSIQVSAGVAKLISRVAAARLRPRPLYQNDNHNQILFFTKHICKLIVTEPFHLHSLYREEIS